MQTSSPPSAGCRNSNRCSDPYKWSSLDRVFERPTPRLKSVFTANYLRFDHTEVLEGILFQAPIDEEIGWDLSAGFRFRPFLNQNFVFVGGVATLLPGDGFEDIFENDDTLYQAFANIILTY